MFQMKKSLKIISIFVCLMLCLAALPACKAEVAMSYDDKALSVNVYEFLLSRMKGTLEYYGYDVYSAAFWNTVTDMDGTTYDDYFKETIKDQAINYLVADKLFDENGLSLSDSDNERIDELMAAYVKRAGSRSLLNSELKEFGVNYEILREIYVLEAKIELLKAHLYGRDGEKIDSAEKEAYFNENYVAFKQIFLATYDYVTDEDRFGDVVYYTDEKHEAIAYDKVNGRTMTDEFGMTVKDVLGDDEYFTEEGRIAYDRVNGVVGYVTDESGDKITVELDEAKKAELYELAEELEKSCDRDLAAFEQFDAEYDESDNDDVIYLFASAGYYAAQNDNAAYFDGMAMALKELSEGECVLFTSDYGYHILRRYENESGAYDMEKYEDAFGSFTDDLTSRLFEELCSERAEDVMIDREVLSSAPSMKDVGSNKIY